jgi:hypothetical protein
VRFWKQQYNYGAAEGQLEQKWPQRYTASGRVAWTGRLYDTGTTGAMGNSRRRIYHGIWGSALFQSVYQSSANLWASLGLMPEWYLLIGALAASSLVGIWWRPLLIAAPLLALAMALSMAQAMAGAARASFVEARLSRGRLLRARILTAFLHLLQPLARLMGRMRHGMAPWRRRSVRRFAWPWPRTFSTWHESWRSGEQRLEDLEKALRDAGVVVLRGGDYDRWDLHLRGGMLGAARVRMTIEEHGSGKQMARYRAWPRWSTMGWMSAGACVLLAAGAGALHLWSACAVSGALAMALTAATVVECGAAVAALRGIVKTANS